MINGDDSIRAHSCSFVLALAFAAYSHIALAAPAAGGADLNPDASAQQTYDYSILRNGSQIGQYTISISRRGDVVTVDFTTDIKVNLLMFTAYQLHHTGEEIWKNGKFVSYQGTTNDNGKRHSVSLTRTTNGEILVADGRQRLLPKGVVPATFWNSAGLKAKTVVDPDTGKVYNIDVEDRGAQMLNVDGANELAQHYHISGLNRDIWIVNGTAVRFELKGSDNSTIMSKLESSTQQPQTP